MHLAVTIERSLSTGGHTEGLPEAHSVSAIPETLTIRGPKRPPINGGESDLRGICSTGRQQVFQFQSIWLKTGIKLQNIYEYPQERVSVSRYWTEGTRALNCERKVRRISSHTGTVKQMLDRMFTK